MAAFLLRFIAETSGKPYALRLIIPAVVLAICAVRLARIDPRINNFIKSQRISRQRVVTKRRLGSVIVYPLWLITKILWTRYTLGLILPIIVLVAWAVRGPWDDRRINSILQGPTIVEQYKSGSGIDPKNRIEEIPPLLKQAKLFAQYLNPPPAPNDRLANLTAKTIAPRPTTSFPSYTAKFTLHGTCYYPSQPEESMALVWQPGGGGGTLQWVKQGTRLGHFIVDEIKRSSITYTGAGQKHEMEVQHLPAPWNLVREHGTDPGRTSNGVKALESVALNGKRLLVKTGKEEEAIPK